MEVIEIVKARLTGTVPEASLLNIYIEEVAQAIQNYLNRADIPKELAFTHANMVVDFITGENRKTDTGAQSSVESIKEGDVTVSFKAAKVGTGERSVESLLFDYSKQLNKFRKMRW